ncbi:MAG: hypothetical protein AAGA74_15660 [Pseudomonadota bacterium]
MFEKARSLILSDRAKARKALTDEIKRNERDSLDKELDQLETDERSRLQAKAADAAEKERVAQARETLAKTRKAQNEQAAKFDDAIASANGAFGCLEALANEAALLEREIGVGSGQRPVIVGHARTGALVAAMWHSARPLSKRLGLRAVPGSARNIRPLTSVYPKQSEEQNDT